MKLRASMIAVLAAFALVAAPAVAQAKPSLGDVNQQVRHAVDVVKHANQSLRSGQVHQAHNRMERAQRELRRAARMSTQVNGGVNRRANAQVRVAGISDRLMGRFAKVLPRFEDVGSQFVMLGGVDWAMNIHQRLSDRLIALAERLPEPARAAVLTAVVKFQDDGDLQALAQAIASPNVVDEVKIMLLQRLDEVHQHVGGVMDQVTAMLGELPIPPMALDRITGILGQVDAMVGNVMGHVGGLLDSIFGSIGGGSAGGLGDLLDGLVPPGLLPFAHQG